MKLVKMKQGKKRPKSFGLIISKKAKERLKDPKKNPNFKTGKYVMKKRFCIDCGKPLNQTSPLSKRCLSCAKSGKLSSFYIDGRSSKKNHCVDCNKEIRISSKRCPKCYLKYHIEQNKVEKYLENLLNDLLPNKYKYVGNSKYWIKGFNPDFINKKDKKIIEMYGDYWHRKSQIRDIKRLEAYIKSGYKTLVIWEHELKDLNEVSKRIIKFNE
jgi:very-short-patch-repair endonuclease